MSPLTEELVKNAVHAYHGYWYSTAGVMFGFFEDPEDAKYIARLINDIGIHAAVIGCQLIITL